MLQKMTAHRVKYMFSSLMQVRRALDTMNLAQI